MTRWAMVADLERCVGCQTCTAACRHANATSPAVQWRKVLDIEAGSFPNVNRTFVPVGCQHCADPPCMHVCPSTATRQRADGIVTIDYDICIGCAYCDVACPYQARFKITKEDFAYGAEAMQNEIEREDLRAPRRRAEMHVLLRSHRFRHREWFDARQRSARDAGLRQCLHRGRVAFRRSRRCRTATSPGCCDEHKSFRMHAELGTEPGFHYLYDKAAAAASAGYPAARSRARKPDAFAPAGSSRGIRNIGIGKPPAISCAAAPAPGCSALRRSPALLERRCCCPALPRSRLSRSA